MPDEAINNYEELQEEYYDIFIGTHEATQNLFKNNEQLILDKNPNNQNISSEEYESFDEPLPVKDNELEKSHLKHK